MIFRLNHAPNRGFYFTGRVALVLLVVLLSTTFAPVVHAQSQENLKVILDRMGRLENDIRNLNLSLARGGTAPVTTPAPASAGASSAPTRAPSTAWQATMAGPGGSHALTRLSVQITELENDLRAVTGSMEEFNFQVGKLTRRLNKLVADMDYRLGLLESRAPGAAPSAQLTPTGPPRINPAPLPPSVQKIIPGQGNSFASKPGILGTVSENKVVALASKEGGNKTSKSSLAAAARPVASPTGKPYVKTAVTAPPVVPQVTPPAQVPGILPEGTPKKQYDFAFGLLRQANYDKAEIALQEFVKRNPKDKLASNARYWLGETYYVRAAYVQAAEVFLEGYQADPKGTKAPDSLLKLGMSLSGLDKKREACAAFDKVSKDFPDVSAGIRNTVAREKQKNSCP